MAKRKKDGGYDMRTKEGKQAQEVENFFGLVEQDRSAISKFAENINIKKE